VPIYEYQCLSSGARFEIQQKMSDPPFKTCDQLSCSCDEAQPVTKVISAPAIMFKGTGWYVTDYSDKLKEPGSKSENNGKPAQVNNAESKADSKPGSTSSESGNGSTTPAPAATSAGSVGSGSSSGSSSSSSSSASSGSGSSSSTSRSS
jgi:putative FmdB family regulatory protein